VEKYTIGNAIPLLGTSKGGEENGSGSPSKNFVRLPSEVSSRKKMNIWNPGEKTRLGCSESTFPANTQQDNARLILLQKLGEGGEIGGGDLQLWWGAPKKHSPGPWGRWGREKGGGKLEISHRQGLEEDEKGEGDTRVWGGHPNKAARIRMERRAPGTTILYAPRWERRGMGGGSMSTLETRMGGQSSTKRRGDGNKGKLLSAIGKKAKERVGWALWKWTSPGRPHLVRE